MLLSEVKKRSIAWCCVAVLTMVTACGQSLHQLAGIEHACSCSAETSSDCLTDHACLDQLCPFESTTDEPGNEDRSCNQSADCCSVCQLLSHLGNGVFLFEEGECRSDLVGRETLVAERLVLTSDYTSHAPRGPPAAV